MESHSRFTLLATLTALLFAPINSFATKTSPIDYKNERILRIVPCCQAHPKTLHDGLYAGLGVGYDSYRVRQRISVTDTNGTLNLANPAVSGRGVVGDAFIGYGQYYEWFYIAGELFTKYTSTHSGYSLNNYNSDFATREAYGASILPGIRLSRTGLFYIRLGYARTFFKAQENGTSVGNFSSSNWGNGIDLGLGAELAVYRNFSLRGEYNYTNYSSFRSKLTTKFSPSNSEFILGFLYRLCL